MESNQIGAAAICIETMQFLCHRCVTNRGHNIPTKCGDNRLNGKKVFFESQDGGVQHVDFWLLSDFDTTYVLSKSQHSC